MLCASGFFLLCCSLSVLARCIDIVGLTSLFANGLSIGTVKSRSPFDMFRWNSPSLRSMPTGFQIVVPPEANNKTLTLFPAYQSRLQWGPSSRPSALQFAMTYDRAGRPIRAIVLEARPSGGDAATLDQKPASESPRLTAEEKDQLSRALKVWKGLKDDARGRIADRLRSVPPSEEREESVRNMAVRSWE